ncbi:MAG: peptidylprolyl isomerase [Treponema sp.]|jgi:hypothetical protein|nr:peptidylprolyl isomerase [Treponema sp.]
MAFKGKKQPPAHEETLQSEFVRRFKSNPLIFGGTIVVLVIVIVAFVFVPAIVPEASGGADLTFGTYNNAPVSYVPGNYFAQRQEYYARYVQSEINEANYDAVTYQVWRVAFEDTVLHAGILAAMAQAGYTPPDELVDKETALRPEFQENGRFSTVKYRQYDSVDRIAIWREVREAMIEDRYRSEIAGLRISSKEVDFIASMASPERSFDMVVFPLNDYPDSEVRSYASSNPDNFLTTHLSKISINSNEREARQILSSIQDGVLSFEDAAETHSQDTYAAKGGDMGRKMVYELVSEASDEGERAAVIALSAGQFSDVVKTRTGWAFFRCEETPFAADTADADTLAKVRRYMQGFERGRIQDWATGQAEEFITLIKADSFDGAVESRGLVKRTFGPLPLNYGDGDGDLFTTLDSFAVPELSNADTSDIFWRTAFFTPVGSPSAPFVVGSDVLVLYPLEENTAAEDKIESARSIVSSYWLSYNTELSLRSFFLGSSKFVDQFDAVFGRVLTARE